MVKKQSKITKIGSKIIIISVFIFAIFCVIKTKISVHAETTSTDISVVGEIRTDDVHQVRFTADYHDYVVPDGRSVIKYGVIMARDKASNITPANFVKGGANINGKEILCGEQDTLDDVDFKVLFVNFKNISTTTINSTMCARAYVILDNDVIVYSPITELCIADLARTAYNGSDSYTLGDGKYVSVIVSTRIVKKIVGDTVTYSSTIPASLDTRNATYDIVRGEYSDNISIDNCNITLKGANYGISGTSDSRKLETTFTGTITINERSANYADNAIIDGCSFTGNAKIVTTTLSPVSGKTGNIEGFTFRNNFVQSSLSSGNGFIYFTNLDPSLNLSGRYDSYLNINNNYFETVSGFNATKFIYLNACMIVNVLNNEFKNMKKDCLYVSNYLKGMAGTLIVSKNTFKDLSSGVMAINLEKIGAFREDEFKINIISNTFDGGSGTVFVNIETSDESVAYTELKINNNTFKNNTKCIWYDASVTCGAEFKGNTIYVSASMISVCKSDGYYSGSSANEYQLIECSNTYLTSGGAAYVLTSANKTNWFTQTTKTGGYDIAYGSDVE